MKIGTNWCDLFILDNKMFPHEKNCSCYIKYLAYYISIIEKLYEGFRINIKGYDIIAKINIFLLIALYV